MTSWIAYAALLVFFVATLVVEPYAWSRWEASTPLSSPATAPADWFGFASKWWSLLTLPRGNTRAMPATEQWHSGSNFFSASVNGVGESGQPHGHVERRLQAATPGTIVTYAGTGTTSSLSDGGAATSSGLNDNRGVAVDTAGNVYVADYGNNRVRMITRNTGIITTVAGGGGSGDSGPATSAQLSGPIDVVVDASGNLFIADLFHARVRLVTLATGIITTYAGGGTQGSSVDGLPATSAQLSFPYAVDVDSSGNLYIADTFKYKLYLVSRSTGLMTTFVGGGIVATLDHIVGVALDSSDNVYVSDGTRVRMVTRSTGIISAVAGQAGTQGQSGDGGPGTSALLYDPQHVAVDAWGNVYVADATNREVRVVMRSSGIITAFAGQIGIQGSSGNGGAPTSALLVQPFGVAVDAVGNVYISDMYGFKIREVAASRTIVPCAGTGTAGFSGDGGPATSAALHTPKGMAVDSVGNVYVADEIGRVRMISRSAGTITTVAGGGSSGDGGTATSAQLAGTMSVAVDESGNLFVLEYSNNKVRLVTKAEGTITTYAGTGTATFGGDGLAASSAQLNRPGAVAVDSSGNLFIADGSNYRVRLVTRSTGIITTLAGTGGPGTAGDGSAANLASVFYPGSLAVDSSDNVYIGDYFRVRLVTRSTGIISTIAGQANVYGRTGDGGAATSAAFGMVIGVAVDTSDNVYVADMRSYNVRVVTSTGIITTFAGVGGQSGTTGDGGPATSALFASLAGVAVDSSGNVFISDLASTIRKVAPLYTYPSAPSSQPTSLPSTQPSSQPTTQPSAQPSSQPSIQPSIRPSRQPSTQPTAQPSVQPSLQPSTQPSTQPSARPSSQPSTRPSAQPSTQPSKRPSKPSGQPSERPSGQPSTQPSQRPSRPTFAPTPAPTLVPTAVPTLAPTSPPPNGSPATLLFSQLVTGVADSTAFRTSFVNGLLAVLPAGSTVVLTSVTVLSSRRQRLLSGSSSGSSPSSSSQLLVVCTITAPQTTTDQLTSLVLSPAFLTSLAAYLKALYPDTSVAAPTVTAVSSAPVAAPATTATTTSSAGGGATGAIVGGVVGGAVLLVGVGWCVCRRHGRRGPVKEQKVVPGGGDAPGEPPTMTTNGPQATSSDLEKHSTAPQFWARPR